MNKEFKIDPDKIEECSYLNIFISSIEDFKTWRERYGFDAKKTVDVKVKIGNKTKNFTVEDFLDRLGMKGD